MLITPLMLQGPWIKNFSPVEMKALKNFSSETEKLIIEYEVLKEFKGEEILKDLLNASKKMSESEFRNILMVLKKSNDYHEKLKILKDIKKY